ncbi:MAG TPA: Ig-like domain-containing protein, partial [Vicinamibacteria bacterium]|nr:Ig-like domain-containing protein [Vicinamibacteria bacterium]
DGDALTYAWSFGDGAVGSGVGPSHTYTSLGTFTVSLVVNDGTASSAPAATTVTITNLLPAVVLTSPPAGSVFHAPAAVTLAADATDPDGSVALVEFFAGSVKVGEDATAPYAVLWSGAAPGAHILTARVTDESGGTGVSAPVTILVNSPPAVSISSPAAGASFVAPATVLLEANAFDLDGTIAQVEFFANGTPLGVATTSPYKLTWSNVAAGVYDVTARATDNLGAVTTSAPRTVRVTAVLATTADSYVRNGSQANNNFGTSTALEVRTASSPNTKWTYLKFDTSAVATVTSARLRLFGNLTSTTSTVVRTQAFGAASTTWTETGITWNNKPPSGTTVLAAVTLVNSSTTARWYEWDLTTYLQQEKAAGRSVVTIVLKNDVDTNPTATFRSRQASSNRPELRVTP